MARGKKAAATLTPEEKLQQALVPDEDQPYEIPENWCYVPQQVICQLSNGEKMDGAEYPYLEVKYLRGNKEAEMVNSGKYIPAYTKVILVDGENSGEVFTVSENGYMGSTFKALEISKAVLPDYLQYFIATKKDLYRNNKKGSAIPHLNKDMFFSTAFPLAPLSEQQRIVDRIESIFAKLDEAKEKAQVVVDGFELRKSAILHKAFTGELIGIKNGETTTLDTIVDCIGIGPFGSALHKEDYVSDGIPVINPKHISNQNIVADLNVSITEDKAEELSSYRLKKGDIVMGRRGEMGRSAPVSENEVGWLCGTGSLIIRLKEGYNSSFYSQIIASHSSVQYLEENCVGSTMKNLNEKVIKSLPVPNYTKEHQQRIVAILDSVLEKEQQAKDTAEAVIDQIDTMKKAILARAFRGELGTNDPAEESAIELLKSVL